MADAPARKPLSLALQGGGSHGAFTWGVLDALIEDGRLSFEAISGTSAGAMNAVVLADGFAQGKAAGARERLEKFWRGVSRDSGPAGAADAILDRIFGFWKMPGFDPFGALQQFTTLASPYSMNPLNINPLRGLLEGLVDFAAVMKSSRPRLFISATNVRTGKIKVFTGAEVTADAILASACLPYLFQAVEVGGEAYWDGGYSGNPALYPFFETAAPEDILLVQVNPVRRDAIPRTASEIMERVSEITFNSSMLREFRAIDFVNRLMAEHRLDPHRYRENRLHRIDATHALRNYAASTKFDTSWSFFQELQRAGRRAGRAWLDEHYADIGVRSTLDLRAEFM